MFWKMAKRLRSKTVRLLLLQQKVNSRMSTNSTLEMLVIEFINDTETRATASTEEIIYANYSATSKVWEEKA